VTKVTEKPRWQADSRRPAPHGFFPCRSYRAPISSNKTLVFGLDDVGEVVEDQQVVFVDLGDGAFEEIEVLNRRERS
jgi:hypothetical protein